MWNGANYRRPRLIACRSGIAGGVAAVRFGRDHDLDIADRPRYQVLQYGVRRTPCAVWKLVTFLSDEPDRRFVL